MKNITIIIKILLFLPFIVQAQNETQLKKISDINVPENFVRIPLSENSFGFYLRNLQLKTCDTVYLFNGKAKANQSAQFAVLNIDAGTTDLQQCADAYMRLEAEWLFGLKNYKNIAFNFTSGHKAKYIDYAEGFRPTISGNNVTWKKTKTADYSYKNFRNYLNLVFTYAGTYSLYKELRKVATLTDIKPGDVFIQTRSPYGHAVIVIDAAKHKTTGEIIFLLAQSYMPAQDIHILVNPSNSNLSPWYSVKEINPLLTPEWTFSSGDLKRR